MKHFKLILFDLDDTLFDFDSCFEKGMKATMSIHPLTLHIDTEKLYNTFKLHSDSLWNLQVEKKVTFNEYRQMRLKEALSEFQINIESEMADDFNLLFNCKFLEVIHTSPAVPKLLSILSTRYQMGIITNGASDTAYKKIINLGIADFFPKIKVFVSEEVGYSKPYPEIFYVALNHFDVKPNETLFVGDSWEADIVGAMNVGISAIWINPKERQPTTEHVPLAIIQNLDELELILRKN